MTRRRALAFPGAYFRASSLSSTHESQSRPLVTETILVVKMMRKRRKTPSLGEKASKHCHIAWSDPGIGTMWLPFRWARNRKSRI